MKNIFLTVIRRGGFDLPTMLTRIDEYHITGKLTDIERDELLAAARVVATPTVNPTDEIQRLWSAIMALRAEIAEMKGEVEDSEEGDEIPEYVQPTGAHDAYYYGAPVLYNGKAYMCVAPEGVACVWSPDVMPDYWQVMG